MSERNASSSDLAKVAAQFGMSKAVYERSILGTGDRADSERNTAKLHVTSEPRSDHVHTLRAPASAVKSSKRKKRQPSYDIANTLAIWEVLGIPRATPEFSFHPERGWRFDFAWIAHKVALEVEGGVWGNGRHNRPTGFIADMEKYNEACCLGWRLLRALPSNLHKSETTELIRRALNP